jgi:hypothetical protein
LFRFLFALVGVANAIEESAKDAGELKVRSIVWLIEDAMKGVQIGILQEVRPVGRYHRRLLLEHRFVLPTENFD